MRLIHVGNLLALAVAAVVCTAGQPVLASEAPAVEPFTIAQVGILPPNQSGQPVKKKPPPSVGNVPPNKNAKPKKPAKAKPKPAPAAKKAPPPKKPPPVVKKAPPPKLPPPVVKQVRPPPKLPPPVVKQVRPAPTTPPPVIKKAPPPTTPPPVVKKATPPPPKKPVVVAPPKRVPPTVGINPALNLQRIKPKPAAIKQNFKAPAKSNRRIGDLKAKRRTSAIAGGNVRVLREPDQRVIVKQNNRSFIRQNDSSRFRRIAPNARTVRLRDGQSQTFFSRGDGVRVYDVTDRNGRLLHRYRVLPGGRRVTLIDNRRYYRDRYRGRDVALGLGIGLAVGSLVALAAPRVDIPRNKYIVEYDDASEYDIYEALSAPPVERLDRGYSLEEIRYSSSLRDRMRRVDLDTVTFDFGSWEVGADQERALERMANGILRVLEDNPDEVFLIEGYTDAVGDEDDNLSLSDRRAQAVAEIMTTVYGVPPENMVTQGYGEENLKVQTEGPERANRRIAVRRISPLMAQEGQEQEDGEDVYQE